MSLSTIIRNIRAKQKIKFNPPDRPTAVWMGKDLLDEKHIPALTIIFQTSGCRWSNCTMCGYIYDSARAPPSHDDLMKQFEHAMLRCRDEEFMVKIFTSGSFFDDSEIGPGTRKMMLTRLNEDARVKKVIAETRPEYVTDEKLTEAKAALGKKFEVAIGLETTNDPIRKDCINKGFSFSDFTRASQVAKKHDVTVKAYLMQKPPFLSEGIAMKDMILSIHEAAPYAQTISMNLCNVQKGTLVDEMFERGDYRPPWLWSAVEALKIAKELSPETIIMSDPVAAGSMRGPHNCGKCDSDVAEAIRVFSVTQDTAVFKNLDCDCKELWKKVIELEDFTFGAPLVK
jgi:radical SAM enzyme (TIGR01210 family)